ncbi:hypothetical protein ES703_119423 [subsurface metagenome]
MDILIFRLSNLSYTKMEYHHEQAKRFHSDRAPGCNRDYCLIDGDIDARTITSEKTGQIRYVSGPAETMGYYLVDVLR